jgi:hypothetical protein
MFRKLTMASVIFAVPHCEEADEKDVRPSRVWLSQHPVSGGKVRFAMEGERGEKRK